MTKRRARGTPTRRVETSTPRRQLLIFVEGKTEDRYFKFWWRANRGKVIVNIDGRHGSPMTLVEYAVARKHDEEREEKRGRGAAHDEVWCVFDVDQHPNLKEAIQLAERNGIKVAVSNPCFELWLILHYEDRTAFIDPSPAQARTAELLKCGKVLTDAALEDLARRHGEASRRAAALDEKHEGDGSDPRSNPSSEVWKAVDRITHAERP